jgi:A/G-specific adenine glycosylase
LKNNLLNFSNTINNWYSKNKRDLPWRETTDPYIIWLSEIILQQTRVEQGMAYFHKFSNKYPTIESLASASEDEVLKDWEGLGYYSRARNMLSAAQFITRELNGKFPNNYTAILKLKGVGTYTAAAISSFAFNEEKAVVDGNVYRVLSRYFGIATPIDSTKGKKEFQLLADELIQLQKPSVHNQAMMEFGAMQCTPKKANCDDCPLKISCVAFQNDLVQSLPIKEKKTKQSKRYFTYIIVSDAQHLIIQKRAEKGIWANMYEFPLIESENLTEQSQLINEQKFAGSLNLNNPKVGHISDTYKHILSHQQIFARFIEINTNKLFKFNDKCLIIKKEELHQFALPKLLVNYLSERDDLLSLLNDN